MHRNIARAYNAHWAEHKRICRVDMKILARGDQKLEPLASGRPGRQPASQGGRRVRVSTLTSAKAAGFETDFLWQKDRASHGNSAAAVIPCSIRPCQLWNRQSLSSPVATYDECVHESSSHQGCLFSRLVQALPSENVAIRDKLARFQEFWTIFNFE
jgi:hypothetical protein